MELSKAQDIEAGDGTTTVVVIAGALLDAAMYLLNKGRYFYEFNLSPSKYFWNFMFQKVENAKLSSSSSVDSSMPTDTSDSRPCADWNSEIGSGISWKSVPSWLIHLGEKWLVLLLFFSFQASTRQSSRSRSSARQPRPRRSFSGWASRSTWTTTSCSSKWPPLHSTPRSGFFFFFNFP